MEEAPRPTYRTNRCPDAIMKTCFIIKLDRMRIAIADVSPADFGCDLAAEKIYDINRINVPAAFRGQGHGTVLLKQIIEEAEKDGVTLRLHVFASGALTTGQLNRWYKRYGFKTMPNGTLTRRPTNDAP